MDVARTGTGKRHLAHGAHRPVRAAHGRVAARIPGALASPAWCAPPADHELEGPAGGPGCRLRVGSGVQPRLQSHVRRAAGAIPTGAEDWATVGRGGRTVSWVGQSRKGDQGRVHFSVDVALRGRCAGPEKEGQRTLAFESGRVRQFRSAAVNSTRQSCWQASPGTSCAGPQRDRLGCMAPHPIAMPRSARTCRQPTRGRPAGAAVAAGLRRCI